MNRRNLLKSAVAALLTPWLPKVELLESSDYTSSTGKLSHQSYHETVEIQEVRLEDILYDRFHKSLLEGYRA